MPFHSTRINVRLAITIDTREQTPWQFPEEFAEVVKGTLSAGDYALQGDFGFAIERKSQSDFLGTIGTGWPRFERELARMEALGFQARVIIVESDLNDLFDAAEMTTSLSFRFILKRISELTLQGVTVLFAGNPTHAAAAAYSIFKRRHEYLGKNNRNVSILPAGSSMDLPEV